MNLIEKIDEIKNENHDGTNGIVYDPNSLT